MRNVFLGSELEIETRTLIRIPVSQLFKDHFSPCKEGVGRTSIIPENSGEKKALILTASKITYRSCCVCGFTQAGLIHSSNPYLDFAQTRGKHLFLCSPNTQGAIKLRTVSVKHIVIVRLHLAWLCWPESLLRGRVWSVVPCFSPIFF